MFADSCWFVWSFDDGRGWHQLGCFASVRQACDYLSSVTDVHLEDSFDGKIVSGCSDTELYVTGETELLRRLFNLGNQPS